MSVRIEITFLYNSPRKRSFGHLGIPGNSNFSEFNSSTLPASFVFCKYDRLNSFGRLHLISRVKVRLENDWNFKADDFLVL